MVNKLWDEEKTLDASLRVVILGSSPLLMQKGLSESLAGRFEIIGFGLVMLLLGIISVTYQADTHTALRKSINMREATETARQAAADNLGPSSDWIRESLTHSMLI